ncbi:Ig-like domain-containing protein [Nocardioides sp. MH1]|uniref:Ig-like domain-containing protein n=1 Tax=Nocardioides sp. MH1 TaxID=3242490 RepID=UPI003522D78C
MSISLGPAGVRAALALALAAAGLALAGPASAAAPVTHDDHKWMYPGQFRQIDVLANDSDPDGDDLAVCRVTPAPDDANYFVDISGGKLVVFTGDASEDIVITYYACDYETLVPATLTISFREVHEVQVVKADRPGRLRVTNDNNRPVSFLYGSFSEPRPDGHARVPANGSLVVRVHRHRIDWVAVLAQTVTVGVGSVRGIDLPHGDHPSSELGRADLSKAEAKAWATAR